MARKKYRQHIKPIKEYRPRAPKDSPKELESIAEKPAFFGSEEKEKRRIFTPEEKKKRRHSRPQAASAPAVEQSLH